MAHRSVVCTGVLVVSLIPLTAVLTGQKNPYGVDPSSVDREISDRCEQRRFLGSD